MRGWAPITDQNPIRWYPSIDFRGEGLFLQLQEDAVANWEAKEAVRKFQAAHAKADREWCQSRGLDLRRELPARYLLLHTLSHLLIRQLSLESGYAEASLRERIYSSPDPGLPMAGVLIYTATPDSDGSLGGLVEMGRPEDLGPVIHRAQGIS
jgi:MrfA Zn-binding domain